MWTTPLTLLTLTLATPTSILASTTPGLRLIETATGAQWMTAAEVDRMMDAKVHHFMDITDHPHLDQGVVPASTIPLPKTLRRQAQVSALFADISQSTMKANLEAFTTFQTRFYTSTTGLEAATWLYTHIEGLIDATASTLRRTGATPSSPVSVRRFEHAWKQFSIVVRFEASRGSLAEETVILGAHLDSVAGFFNKATSRAPGADDDGSGSMTNLEVLRILLNIGFAPKRPVEFHWYSGEEAGLLGSQDMAKAYKSAGRSVLSMLQVDMDGYTGKQNVVGLVNDFVAPDVVAFMRNVITTYVDIPIAETKCKYACSDHASWTKAGYPAAFTTEADMKNFSPYIHTKKDTVATIDFGHMEQFARMALGYVMELGLYEA